MVTRKLVGGDEGGREEVYNQAVGEGKARGAQCNSSQSSHPRRSGIIRRLDAVNSGPTLPSIYRSISRPSPTSSSLLLHLLTYPPRITHSSNLLRDRLPDLHLFTGPSGCDPNLSPPATPPARPLPLIDDWTRLDPTRSTRLHLHSPCTE